MAGMSPRSTTEQRQPQSSTRTARPASYEQITHCGHTTECPSWGTNLKDPSPRPLSCVPEVGVQFLPGVYLSLSWGWQLTRRARSCPWAQQPPHVLYLGTRRPGHLSAKAHPSCHLGVRHAKAWCTCTKETMWSQSCSVGIHHQGAKRCH